MIKDVSIPDRVRFGIKKNHRSSPLPANLKVFGADTETVHGLPHTVQIYDGKEPALFYVNAKTVFKTFWDYVKERSRRKGVNLCYFHNLKFDLLILFHQYHRFIYEQYNDISFTIREGKREIEVSFIYGKVNAGKIKEGDVTVKLLDSRHFTQASLDNSLSMFQIPFNKKPTPEGLGDLYLKDDEFEDYAKTDVVSEYHLAKKILEFHDQYKVSPCVSLPQFAAKVFRHFYFEPDTTIEFPPPAVLKASEQSYHGGKNGFYLPGPRLIKNVYEVDINSSYPNAMAHLPQMTKGTYNQIHEYDPDRQGIYRISGFANPERKYPILYDAGFKRVNGPFVDIYVTSHEIPLMKKPDYDFQIEEGFVWTPEPYYVNPFKKFTEDFYRLKETTPKSEKALYTFYKITLNALYGKFISTVEKREFEWVEEKKGIPLGIDMVWDAVLKRYILTKRNFVASAMYNPFVGSLITGFARARLYEMEVKYEALHSATDSVKTLIKPKEVDGLGGQKLESFGTCYFFRNKFYLHYSQERNLCGHDSVKFPFRLGDSHLCKVALHGYKAKTDKGIAHLVNHRDEFLETHHLRYDYQHVVGLREGLKQGEAPADFIKRDEVVCLCNNKEVSCADSRDHCHCS